MNFTSIGTLTLSGSILFDGTLSDIFTSHSASRAQLMTADFNGVQGTVVFLPNEEEFSPDNDENLLHWY